eukprot:4430521-Pleurochrysis_carterae.AAC.1
MSQIWVGLLAQRTALGAPTKSRRAWCRRASAPALSTLRAIALSSTEAQSTTSRSPYRSFRTAGSLCRQIRAMSRRTKSPERSTFGVSKRAPRTSLGPAAPPNVLKNLITKQPLQGRAGSSLSLGPTLSTTHA